MNDKEVKVKLILLLQSLAEISSTFDERMKNKSRQQWKNKMNDVIRRLRTTISCVSMNNEENRLINAQMNKIAGE